MIGLAVRSTERDIAAEFFELFKTPWEFYRSGQHYDVVICTQEECGGFAAKLVLLYNAGRMPFDAEIGNSVKFCQSGAVLSCNGQQLPLYGEAATFSASRFSAFREDATREPMAFLSSLGEGEVLRIGYDLFQEVRLLLTVGQPPANAGKATLEWHIALLRDLITRAGLPLVEIPPVPEGYGFTVCLTHDLDHPVLRNHCCDHTMFGFLYRATIGSLISVCRGRKTVRNFCRNWIAATKLPFVYLGMAKDPWRGFDRYLEIEAGLGATYFVIPKRDYPGRLANGTGPARRAARYAVEDIKPELEKIASTGNEIALHGLDAWLDSAKANEERDELSRFVGATKAGVRMHWLFFDEKSPAVLDRAGFLYDSTIGYNEAVGYRAGTTQAYRPPGCANLIELPLHIMDTALFYSSHLNLNDHDSGKVVSQIIEDMDQFGGALTINWHDRSIAPERLWEDFYRKLIAELKDKGAWFPTATDTVSWFKKRRSVTFGNINTEKGVVTLSVSAKEEPTLPGLRVRVHKPTAQSLSDTLPSNSSAQYVDVGFKINLETSIAISA